MTAAITITTPWNGDVLNRHDGTVTPAGLAIDVRGQAPDGLPITVTCEGAMGAGTPPARCSQVTTTARGGEYAATLPLQGRHNTITAATGQHRASIRVLWDKDSRPRYRFSVDDNILLLKDLAESGYASLFEHWYLAFWRGLHQRYGTKVHLNIYYRTDESVYSGATFALPEMPDRFRAEWQANAGWLHLTFHARSNKPDWPYREATYGRMAADYEAVTNEIRRFAGEETLSSFTTVHWASAPRPAVCALRERGIRGLIGLFYQQTHGSATNTAYYLAPELAAHVAGRDYWWDPDLDMAFVSCDAVVNSYPLDAIVPRLDVVGGNAHTGELIELLIHEQYFRRELPIHQADVQERVVRAVEWVAERGYKPVFWGEGFVGT